MSLVNRNDWKLQLLKVIRYIITGISRSCIITGISRSLSICTLITLIWLVSLLITYDSIKLCLALSEDSVEQRVGYIEDLLLMSASTQYIPVCGP